MTWYRHRQESYASRSKHCQPPWDDRKYCTLRTRSIKESGVYFDIHYGECRTVLEIYVIHLLEMRRGNVMIILFGNLLGYCATGGNWKKISRFILVYADAMKKLYWSIAWASDFFTRRPPWRGQRNILYTYSTLIWLEYGLWVGECRSSSLVGSEVFYRIIFLWTYVQKRKVVGQKSRK